ncbi:MAG: response regulator [Armatimonadetes bacterium]|nr:response regulator [Armatimonadota bacterium]
MSAEQKSRPVILVVEDDANQRLYYQEELEAAGYEVVTASSGPEAVEKVSAGGIDLVLLDIGMPGMDGIEALARILDIDRELPVILNTAYSDYRDDFMTWTAEAYVTKSSDPSLLHKHIRDALLKHGIQPPPETGETTQA